MAINDFLIYKILEINYPQMGEILSLFNSFKELPGLGVLKVKQKGIFELPEPFGVSGHC